MDMLFFVIGLIGAPICLIWLIVSAARKKPIKISAIALSACIVLFFFSIFMTPTPNQDSSVGSADQSAQKESGSAPDETDEAPEPNTSAMVDYIAKQAKADAVGATDAELEDAYQYICDTYTDCFGSNDVMEKMMYSGWLLEYAYQDNNDMRLYAEIGMDAEQLVKGVYRGAEEPTDDGPVSNMDQISKAISEIVQANMTSYSDGMYKVGTDIPAGEYLIIPTSSGYYQVSSDSTGTLDSIVANDNFTGSRYLTVSDGQYLTLTRCKAYSAQYISDGTLKNNNFSNGMYKVGVDIAAGEYKVTATGDGYFEVDSSSSGTLDAIVSNKNFTGDAYVTVSDGQYLKLSRAALNK